MGAIHCPQRSGNGQQWQYQMRGSSGVATRRRASSQAYDSRRGRGNLVEGELFVWLERALSFLFCLIDYSPQLMDVLRLSVLCFACLWGNV